MSSENIFKKCDSKIFLQSKIELEPTTNIEEKDKDIDAERAEESVVEFSSAKLDFKDDLEPDENGLLNDNDLQSAEDCPTIPNKIFSGTKNVLKIIGWINEKINKSNSPIPNISQESSIENKEEYLQGTEYF